MRLLYVNEAISPHSPRRFSSHSNPLRALCLVALQGSASEIEPAWRVPLRSHATNWVAVGQLAQPAAWPLVRVDANAAADGAPTVGCGSARLAGSVRLTASNPKIACQLSALPRSSRRFEAMQTTKVQVIPAVSTLGVRQAANVL
jgi:hypothetical protein